MPIHDKIRGFKYQNNHGKILLRGIMLFYKICMNFDAIIYKVVVMWFCDHGYEL